MTMEILYSAHELAERCNDDGEFKLAARYWNGGLQFGIGEKTFSWIIENGVISEGPEGFTSYLMPVLDGIEKNGK